MQVLTFVFQDAPHFIGAAFLIYLVLDGIKGIVDAWRQ